MEIQDYPGYFIYRDGRVWSDKSKRFLKTYNITGYKSIKLNKHNKSKGFLIHRLIAIHYIPNPNNYPHIDHINRVRQDNRIENLRWASESINMNNSLVRKNNNCGIKNICYYEGQDIWCFSKYFEGKLHRKYFKIKEEAIKYKESYIKSLNLEVL
jgi:hypothetical protein